MFKQRIMMFNLSKSLNINTKMISAWFLLTTHRDHLGGGGRGTGGSLIYGIFTMFGLGGSTS